jgi:Ca-activated chloride channel family protein
LILLSNGLVLRVTNRIDGVFMQRTLCLLLAFCFMACNKPDSSGSNDTAKKNIPEGSLVIRLDYGSEKKTWMEEMVTRYHQTNPKTKSGKPIFIDATSMGSGEIMQGIVAGVRKPHVFSPASSAYVTLLNQYWLAQQGSNKIIAPDGDDLLLSPIVIAMWKPMAEALGWPNKPIGWAEITAIGQNPKGWDSLGHPEWGRFKLGHTHPKLSNSGLLAVLAEAYAGAKKTRDLTEQDLNSPEVQNFLSGVETTLVHYGKSTNFFADKMLSRGPGYISAAVLYENVVIESYSKTTDAPFPIVSIYPAEGTFWSDHPYSILDASWVNDEEREAAGAFLAFLKEKPQQQRALELGFRPADTSITIGSPIDAAHGADAKQPQTLLDVPSGPTLLKLLETWEATKKTSDVVLVFDKSGSMRGEPLKSAKDGAVSFLKNLGDRDQVSLLLFDNNVYNATPPTVLGSGGREDLISRIQNTTADGGTALYDATVAGFKSTQARANTATNQIHAVVVMTDGKDESSSATLDQVKQTLSVSDELTSIKVFTIAYGAGADPTILAEIAEAGKGSSAKGDTASILTVFQDMAAFF